MSWKCLCDIGMSALPAEEITAAEGDLDDMSILSRNIYRNLRRGRFNEAPVKRISDNKGSTFNFFISEGSFYH